MTLRLNPAQIALAALCSVLAVLLGYMAFAPLPEIALPQVRAPAQVSDDSDDAPLPRFQVPPKQAFAEVDDRSVFNPARVRVVSASQPGAPSTASLPSDLSLVGVIMDGETKLALFKSPAAPLAVGVNVGGSIDGWQVTRVEPDGVALRAGGPEQELKLSTAHPPPGVGANGGPGALPPAMRPPGFPRPNFPQQNENGNENNNNNNNNNSANNNNVNNNNPNKNNNNNSDNSDDDDGN